MPELKRIPMESIPAAIQKALRYRLLNEPLEAESICRDVLLVEPENQEALVTLVLALTDQFDQEFTGALEKARQLVPQLRSPYDREYYMGIIHERWAKAQLARGVPAGIGFDWFRTAMRYYQEAELLRAADDPDAILRWNACARLLEREERLQEATTASRPTPEPEFVDHIPDY